MSAARRQVRWWIAALAALALAGCVKNVRGPAAVNAATVAAVDSATVALWRFDETGGLRGNDSGPHHLDGTAGEDTRTAFGRMRGARYFGASVNSFFYVPPSSLLDLGSAFTIEAWITPSSLTTYEDMTIAARWSPQTDDHSWIFALVCSRLVSGPGWHKQFVRTGQLSHLMFVFQPDEAGVPIAFHSQSAIELDRWTHVAVTYDGEVVSFWVNGEPDGVFAITGRVRPSRAPLIVGNFFDDSHLTDFGGDLRQDSSAETTPYYAFIGGIDELRISNVARTQFRLSGGR